jgi:Uma2 family endonuclease
MMSSPNRAPELPAVDAPLVAEDCGYEIIDGRLVAVPPALEPHGERHSKINALLEAYVIPEYNVACDMLTRTSETTNIAPDASVYPRARDPRTGGRQLEELAFEVVSTQALADVAERAQGLTDRGVRRVFAVDVPRARGLEWSRETDAWQVLADDAVIEDPCFVAPLPIEALVKAARADDAVARALLAKGNPVLTDALEQAAANAARSVLLGVFAARGFEPTDDQRRRIDSCPDAEQLQTWAIRAATADRLDDVFEL